MSYGFAPEDYLIRARDRIKENSPEGLFYAALELRSYLEARQHEYLSAQKEYAKSFPKLWETTKQWKALKKVYANDIQHLQMVFDGGWTLDAFHTPVTQAHKVSAERLSEYLHARTDHIPPRDPWWEKLRADVEGVYRLSWLCHQGNLLSPALLYCDKIQGSMALRLPAGEAEEYRQRLAVGAHFVVKVDYLSQPPGHWVVDI